MNTPLTESMNYGWGESSSHDFVKMNTSIQDKMITTEQREARRRKISSIILTISLLFTLIGSLAMVVIGSNISSKYVMDLRNNWLTNTIENIYISPEKSCVYDDKYVGLDTLGYANKFNASNPFTVRFRKYQGVTLCVTPKLNTNIINVLYSTIDSKCPKELSLDCGVAGCYPPETPCPISSFVLEENPIDVINPAKQYCYGTTNRQCYNIKVGPNKTDLPIVQLKIDPTFASDESSRFVCSENTIREPLRYDKKCTPDASYHLVSSYTLPTTEVDLVRENIQKGIFIPSERDKDILPALFSRRYIPYEPRKQSYMIHNEVDPDVEDVGDKVDEDEIDDNDNTITLFAKRLVTSIFYPFYPFVDFERLVDPNQICKVIHMETFLKSSESFSSDVFNLLNLHALSFLLIILSIVACFILYRTRLKSMEKSGTFSLRLHALASLIVFGACIGVYVSIIKISNGVIHTLELVIDCIDGVILKNMKSIILSSVAINVSSFISMLFSFISLMAYIYNSYILKHGVAP